MALYVIIEILNSVYLLSLFLLLFNYVRKTFHSDNNQIYFKEPIFDLSPQRILFVTAFYPLQKSKYDNSVYRTWIPQFMQFMNMAPLYFFTPNASKSWIHNRNFSNVIYNTTFESAWDFPLIKNYSTLYSQQHIKDPERSFQNPNLYAVWNSKIVVLEETTKKFPYYKYYIWIDSGSFREPDFYKDTVFPRPDLAEYLDSYQDPPLEFFFTMVRAKNNTVVDIRNDMIEGGFFGGTKEGVNKFFLTYFKCHDYLKDKGITVGKEQNVMNYLFLNNPSNISIYVVPDYSKKSKCMAWMAFYSAFSHQNRCGVDNVLYKRSDYFIRMKNKLGYM